MFRIQIRMDPGFFADPDPGLKVRIRIRPLINLWDLNDGFDKVLEEPDQKDSVKSATYEIYNFFLLLLQF